MRTSHLFNTQIWSRAVWGEYIKSPHKERHTSTYKEPKKRGQAPFFSLSDEVLFVQGGCRAPNGTGGQREEREGADDKSEGGGGEWLLHCESMHKRRVSVGDSGERRGFSEGV